MGYRPEFEAALAMFAKVSSAVDARGYRPPILVGGAAVELYSQSAISTGDFDVVSTREDVLFAVLADHGFIQPAAPGHSFPGWYHPELKMGFEVVGSSLLDGNTDADKLKIFRMDDAAAFVAIAPEDLIADRMGQFASGTAPEMLEQARSLFALCKDLDLHYMEKRIRTETLGQYGVSDVASEG